LGNRYLVHEIIEGQVQEKKEAQKTYDNAIKEGKSTAAILTQEGLKKN
jgi:hypothetical protein